MEHEFHASVGCHVLFSSASEGAGVGASASASVSAVRYETTDSFFMQLEGQSKWSMYEPLDENKLQLSEVKNGNH
jgi:hypothetical protein